MSSLNRNTEDELLWRLSPDPSLSISSLPLLICNFSDRFQISRQTCFQALTICSSFFKYLPQVKRTLCKISITTILRIEMDGNVFLIQEIILGKCYFYLDYICKQKTVHSNIFTAFNVIQDMVYLSLLPPTSLFFQS